MSRSDFVIWELMRVTLSSIIKLEKVTSYLTVVITKGFIFSSPAAPKMVSAWNDNTFELVVLYLVKTSRRVQV